MSTKTLYLWDLAGTLFDEKWDEEKTGYPSYSHWLMAKFNIDKNKVSPRVYEEMFKIPYQKGWYYNLALKPGFKKVLSWTKHNETFSTGVLEQIDWRAQYLNPRVGFDIRKFFQKFNSTFDYGETNTKTKVMLVDYLQKKYNEGYQTIVYTDDKLANCGSFREAATEVRSRYKDFSYRIYYILNDSSGLKDKGWCFKIGSLYDLLKNEQQIST